MRFRNEGSGRRDFLKRAAAGAAAMAFAAPGGAGQGKTAQAKGTGFKLKYAPGLGVFAACAGKSPVDQLKFMADQGFSAWFDNGLMGKPPAEQEELARESQRLGLTIGPFVVYADFSVESFVIRDAAINDMLEARFKTPVETGQRTGCRWTLAVPGRYNQRLHWDYQTANVVENLKRMAAICEPSGLVLDAVEVEDPRQLPVALEALGKRADALWGLPDRLVLTPDTAKQILLLSFRNRVPFVGPSPSWVKAGALYALAWDYEDLGMQCGELVGRILQDGSAANTPPVAPRKILYAVNKRTMQHMKIELPDTLLRGASELF